ncbi:MAG: hypothetical protein L6R36_005554 [Xanthoria steineri]|nr:MAG: hypothetical protein L6R36_005554 [Xanthoria steineri]
MFSLRPFSKIWSRRAVSHSTIHIHTIAKPTMQRTESDESDSISLSPAPSGEIAHSRSHGVGQIVVQEDADEEEEDEDDEEETEEWISVSQTKINEPDNDDVQDETTTQTTYLPSTPPTPQPLSPPSSPPSFLSTSTSSLPSAHLSTPASTPTTTSPTNLPLTQVGTDATIITQMKTMLSRLEKSQETDFLQPHRQEAEFMYSDPWIMLEMAEAELRDRVVFLLRGVLYGAVD